MKDTNTTESSFQILGEAYETWMDFNFKMMQNSMEIVKNCWDSGNYEKLYSTWSENVTEMMEKMMRTPGFTENSWNMFKSTMGFQKFLKMMTSMYLKSLDIPEREEIDELSERINYFDDRIEKIQELLESILEKTNTNQNIHA
jgi:DNA anti-recombination protein RmuC